MTTQVKNKVCLIVHDGWGIASEKGLEGNAIEAGNTENMDRLGKEGLQRELTAHGTAVGLSEGLMGNSEVGHLNIGAGRIVWQDIVRIDVSVKKRTFHKNQAILDSFKRAKDGNGRLHLLGLVSDGGVHSHNTHLYALLETAKEQGVPETYVHFFGDGRDTSPKSAAGYAQELLDFMAKENYGTLATVVGRYYAMDRDKRWERVKIAVDGLVGGEGASLGEGKSIIDEIKASYEKDVTDEFLKPIIVNGDAGRIKDGDTLFFFNYRSDRMRELVTVLGLPDPPMEVTVPKDLGITTMSRYNTEFPFPIAFPPQAMTDVLAEWLSKKGAKQAHVAGQCALVIAIPTPFLSHVTSARSMLSLAYASSPIHRSRYRCSSLFVSSDIMLFMLTTYQPVETEKYAHVTFFFNGGVEKQFEAEERFMVPSPKVATYDLQPAMNVQGVADKVAELVKNKEYEFVMCNFAPPDMVGHTGSFDAAVEAITHTDAAVGTIAAACRDAGYVLLITADHGNAEQMLDPKTKEKHTAHTCGAVPFIVVGAEGYKLKEDGSDEEEGALCDVAPTVLELMVGLLKSSQMDGHIIDDTSPQGLPKPEGMYPLLFPHAPH
ncbi:Phosphoglycerate-bisphosphoglycerate-independent [Mycena sanguinolenta]|uniref:2,3-bisphosphoglycerate-independent phosphoglycerate mutase n=1 Tax=Mycena sanguinolenta TaxID=230812 RepID=A0A8H7D0L6_9AGAR|nr:Phosphoglycerate-bisphosphoglycerate-independent [Mycena sanguinolenta]